MYPAISPWLRIAARRLLLSGLLMLFSVVSGCIEGASFHGGVDAVVRDASDVRARDGAVEVAADAGGPHDVVPDAVGDAGGRDARDGGGPMDAGVDTRRPDVAPPDTADVPLDASAVPFPCTSDAQCAAALGDAPGPCFIAACHPQGRYCFFRALPNGSPVLTDDPCALAVHCELGQPRTTVARDCDDGNACTDDRCESGVGCAYEPLTGAPCDDANACSSEGQCLAGTCVSATNTCPCTADSDCAPFDDADRCNGHLTCDTGICVVAPDSVVRCAPPDAAGCTRLACQPATGACEPAPKPDGSPCLDGDRCTAADACEAGLCRPGPALDCDDGNPCSTEACDPATGCAWTALAEGACDDGDPCTGGDRCVEGLCQGDRLAACACEGDEACAVHDDADRCNGVLRCADGFCALDRRAVVVCAAAPADCSSLDCACARTLCDAATGECTFEPLPDGLPCGDDDACTLTERCNEGTCEAGLWLPCDDADPCTTDRCDPVRGCVHEPSDAACDDGVPCTAPDHCEAGACTGAPYVCEDGKPCTEDRCLGDGTCSPPILQEGFCDIEGVGCVAADDAAPADSCQLCDPLAAPRAWSAAEDGAACDDGDACTEGDACEEGVCAGTPRVCADEDACTTDGCDPATGCMHEAVACDDDFDCTEDACAPATGCTHTPDDGACDDGESCTLDRCDADLGCVSDGAPREGGACDDGDACTTGTTCLAGQCQGGSPLPVDEIDDRNECTADGCDPATGPTHEPRLDEPCTTSDTPCPVPGTCQRVGDDAVCVGAPVDCGDDDPCTDDRCDPDQPGGCLREWNTADCEDDDPCTVDDVCAEGQCTPGVGTLDCDDAVECTDDACEPGFGCDHVPNDAACEDGNPCTVDTCSATADCAHEHEADGVACGADLECRSGACEWAGTCAGAECPPLPGYTVACNPQAHCEYANEDPTGWRQWDVWIYVPPGSFEMGSPEGEGQDDEHPQHAVTFAEGFFVAKYELSVAEYEACEAASPDRCTPPSTESWDLSGWGVSRSSNGRSAHPQNGLTWEQAASVCAWSGARLPSECEWEYAAKGPTHRRYPWGNEPEPSCTNDRAVLQAGGASGYGCESGGTWPMGSKPAGASWCGALDMAGNLWEWSQDWYIDGYDGAPDDGGPWVSIPGTNRVWRGGSYADSAAFLRATERGSDGPANRSAHAGVRCVRDFSPVGVYCNTACPALPGYDAACNSQNHCEYTRSAPTEPWHQWDVWIWVLQGSFPMGSDEGEGAPHERPQHEVTLSRGFFIQKFEVTAAAYAAFLTERGTNSCAYDGASGDCFDPNSSYRRVDWNGAVASVRSVCEATPTGERTEDCGGHPVNEVRWYGAGAFCNWVGGRIPTEAEWERSAKGTVHRLYPWGDDPPNADRANCSESSCADGFSQCAPVGAFLGGASPIGAMDMAGNVWEWVTDRYSDVYYIETYPSVVDPVGPNSGSERVLRGGFWNDDASTLRAAVRQHESPDRAEVSYGVRCARDLPCESGETPTAAGCTIPGADCAGHIDGVFCGDGDPCTAGDTCQAGVCTAGPPNACDDGDACTVDSCDSATGCGHAPADDGTACGADHECVAGECAWLGTCGGTPCPALPGYAAACNAVSQCEYTNEDGADWRQWDVWIYVPPGRFDMGAPEEESASTADERPVHSVSLLDGFLVAKHELVVAQYEACGAAGACTEPSVTDWDPGAWGLNSSANGRADHPQNGIDQAQAAAACAWLGPGGRLPTEAEWEYAASGPTRRTYPWGDAPAPTCENGTAVFSEVGDPSTGCGVNGTWPAGSMPAGASAFGALDMAGSLHEWTADCWHDSYTGAPADGSAWTTGCTEAHAPLRGGAFLGDPTGLRSADRPHIAPDRHQVNIGARCVRPVSPVGVYCNTACPALPGYAVACNAQSHCEYARAEQTEAWHEWDVWIWVPPGSFLMGAPETESGSYAWERPVHLVEFQQGYFLSKHEIVVSEYEACEASGSCGLPSTADHDGTGWGLNRSPGRSAHPQNGLTKSQTRDFCAWVAPGGRLPSESEWERAAGGPEHRTYPWGESPVPSCEVAVIHEGAVVGCDTGGTWPVGEKPGGASIVGALDMIGNVDEWNEDCWHDSYGGAPDDGGAWTSNCDGALSAERGNSFHGSQLPDMRTASRGWRDPEARTAFIGGRCVRPLPARSCGGVICPELPGFVATCNRQQHCELVRAQRTEPWHAWDVWIYVPPGTFEMGSATDEVGHQPDEAPVHPVTFAEGFLIAKREATVAQHEACEAAGACATPSVADWDGEGWGLNRSGNGRSGHPQNGLAWEEAGAVCTWLGGRLPTESEWEYAATGAVHRKYPWGDAPGPTCANGTAVFNEVGGSVGFGCGSGGTWPVGSVPAGEAWCGALDMGGNVWEWTEDWYHSSYDLDADGTVDAPVDGRAWISPPHSNRVLKGGSFYEGGPYTRTATRDEGGPARRYADRGVRCAHSVPEVCNGVDDDGDGLLDAADDELVPGAEGGDLAGDGRDNDCDGVTDEDEDLDHDGVCAAEGCAPQAPDTCPTVWNPDNAPLACAPLGEGWTRARAVALTVPDVASGTAAARRTAEPVEVPLANGILDDSVLGYWPLADGAATDASGHGNNGQLQGEPQVTDGPLPGVQALLFDGIDAQVRLAHTATLEPTGPSSVSLWLRTTRGSPQMLYSAWFGWDWRGLNLGVAYGCSASIPEGRAVLTVGDDSPQCSAAVSRTTVSDGRWHHVVGVFRPGSPAIVELWVDGSLDAAQTTPVAALGWGANRCPGPTVGVECEWPTTGGGDNIYRFGGSLADVVLFGRALAPEEIAGYYRSHRPYASALVPGAQGDFDDLRVSETAPSGGAHTVPAEVLGPRPHSDSPCPAGAAPATWPDRDDLCGVRGYWTFDGTNLDVTGNNELFSADDATFSVGRLGDGGGAKVFHGGLRFRNPVIGQAPTFTIEAWISLDAGMQRGGMYTETSDGWSDQRNQFYVAADPDGRFHVVYDQSSPPGGGLSSATHIGAEQWTHVAVVVNHPRRQLYVNGIVDAADELNETYSGMTIRDAWIGYLPAAPADAVYAGKMDEVVIHSVAKSPEYIYRRANPGVPTVRFLAHTAPTPDGAGRFPFLDYRLHWGNADATMVPAILTGLDETTRCVGLLSPCLGYAGWWRFNEGAGTAAVDASTGKRSGTLQGATSPPAWVAGAEGTALSFDGSEDSVDVPEVPVVPDGSPFSLEAVVAPSGCPHAGDRARIAEREGADGGYSLALTCADGTAAAAVESNGWSWVQGPVLAAGQLAALAAVSEATTLTLFADAVPSAPMALVDADTTSAADFRIGANAGPGGLHFWGVIDSVRLMTRALAPDELLHYPAARWSFGPLVDGAGQPVE